MIGQGSIYTKNWDANKSKITITIRGEQKILVDVTGTPLHRSTGDRRYKEFEVQQVFLYR